MNESVATPHRCPICNGTGHVPAGFYSGMTWTGTTNDEPCRQCFSTGVLWSRGAHCPVGKPQPWRPDVNGETGEAMTVSGEPRWRRMAMYWAVRWFGRGAYRTGPARYTVNRDFLRVPMLGATGDDAPRPWDLPA